MASGSASGWESLLDFPELEDDHVAVARAHGQEAAVGGEGYRAQAGVEFEGFESFLRVEFEGL